MSASIWLLLLCPATCFSQPVLPFWNTSHSWKERVADLVSRLTFDEKVLQMTKGGAAKNSPTPAIDRLGIEPHIWGSECATGLGSDDTTFGGTSFPQPLGLAATWDKAMALEIATAMHVELRAQHNSDVAHGVVKYHHGINCWSPVVNIMRHWSWGRNDETFGECPVLSAAFARSFVRGLQGDHPRYVAASAGCKHFDVHGGPDGIRETFSANVSQRDWATTFLPAFESCVESGTLGMMCSYNSIRGVPACANHRAMTTWAREQWNFTGYIVSDQGAAYGILSDHKYSPNIAEAAAAAVSAGLDLEDANDAEHVIFAGLPEAVQKGLLSEEAIDTAVSRLFYVRMRMGEFDPPEMNPYRQIGVDQIRSAAHLKLARQVAASSLVLLNNVNSTLPFHSSRGTYAVVGPFGDCQACMQGKYSPKIDIAKTTTVVQALNKSGIALTVAAGCKDGPACKTYDKLGIINATSTADAVIIAVGLGSRFESEKRDHKSLDLPGHQNSLVADAIQAAHARGVPAVVLLFLASPISPSLVAQADAVIDCFYPSEMAGDVIVDALWGKFSPAGRLPFSWPTLENDVLPVENYTMQGRTYRYEQANVAWPFGFGLSYTFFKYSNAMAAPTVLTPCDTIILRVDVTNIGNMEADEVVQSYLRWSDLQPPVETPSLSLADFSRVTMKPGQTMQVELHITPRHMAILTSPRCGVATDIANTRLLGQPLRNVVAHSVDACCSLCASLDLCEAWSYMEASKSCQLFKAWTRTVPQAGVTSGQPLPLWTVRPGTLELFIGGGQPQHSEQAIKIAVVGKETPVHSCRHRDRTPLKFI